MLKKILLIMIDFRKKMNQKNIGSFSASIAFFLFLSLVPMLILICTIIPFTTLTEENLINVITEVIPSAIDPIVVEIVSDIYDKSAGVLSVAAIFTVWSAGKGVLALIRGLNEVNNVTEKRNYFVLRIVASFYTLIVIIMVLLALVLNVFGNVLLDMIFSSYPEIRNLFNFLMYFRFLAVWVILTILFTFIYAVLPDKKMKLRFQIPGAAFSAIVWSAFSWGFSVYVEATKDHNTYGNLSIIILIMLWMYFCSYIVLIGAQINRYFGPVYSTLFFKKKEKIKRIDSVSGK